MIIKRSALMNDLFQSHQFTDHNTLNRFFKDLDAYLGQPQKLEAFLKDTERRLLADPDRRPLLIAVYNEQGSFFRSISHFDDSIAAFQKGQSLILDLWGPDCLAHATLLNNMAGTWRLAGETEHAIDLFLKAIQIYRKLGTENTYAFASAQNNLSLAYQQTGQPRLAINHLHLALNLIQIMPDHHTQLAVTYGNLCTLYHQIGDDALAMDALNQSLDLYEAHKESKNVHYAAVLNSLGAFLFQSGDNARAAEIFQKAAAYTEKFFGKNLDYAIAYKNLYWVYRKMKNLPQALDAITVAHAAYRGRFGETHERTRWTADELARVERLARR